ncbi:GGDEF domain-containing protein [Silvimonas amylolytica]|uniref:diguanylate cyclase n=1 Tax=Silvimonas amylolytica TaxID=449663 RepID=A0ABQ2PNB4_9NEIS|nr:GGDEF domain-containing protein [Silvimonas amylolytica]GGP26497.1 GGDEF domain-containing protein [Silvimonas amylolytica]
MTHSGHSHLLDTELDLIADMLLSAPEEARRVALNIAEEAAVLHSHATLARARLYHALTLMYQGQVETGTPILERAIEAARRHRLVNDLPVALDQAADSVLLQGRFDQAMRYWVECLELAIAARNTALCVRSHLGIGKIHFALGDFETAKTHHLRSAEYGHTFYDPTIYCATYLCLAADFLRLEQTPSAFVALKIAHDALPKARGKAVWQIELAAYYTEAHTRNGDYAAAQTWIDEALDACEQGSQRQQWGEIITRIAWAGLLEHQNKPADALTQLHQALDDALILNAPSLVLRIHHKLYAVNKAFGQFEAALHHHRAWHQALESQMARLNEQKVQNATQRRLARLEQRMELERARHENHRLLARVQTHEQTIQTLSSVAQTDALTGAWNRRALEERLARLHEESCNDGWPLCVLMIDLDHFKEINDRFTHIQGDQVLKGVVHLIATACRSDEFIARYGGEEFTLLLPGLQLSGALQIAERIRTTVHEHEWPALPDVRLTVSIGAAELREGEAAASLLARADMALYEAKRSGRNKVCLAES